MSKGTWVFMIFCLSLPVGLFTVSGNPAFVVIFLSGFSAILAEYVRRNKR